MTWLSRTAIKTVHMSLCALLELSTLLMIAFISESFQLNDVLHTEFPKDQKFISGKPVRIRRYILLYYIRRRYRYLPYSLMCFGFYNFLNSIYVCLSYRSPAAEIKAWFRKRASLSKSAHSIISTIPRNFPLNS